MSSVEKFFFPALGRIGVRSAARVLYWRKCKGAMHRFVKSEDKETFEVAVARAVKMKDLFSRIKNKQ